MHPCWRDWDHPSVIFSAFSIALFMFPSVRYGLVLSQRPWYHTFANYPHLLCLTIFLTLYCERILNRCVNEKHCDRCALTTQPSICRTVSYLLSSPSSLSYPLPMGRKKPVLFHFGGVYPSLILNTSKYRIYCILRLKTLTKIFCLKLLIS